MLSLNFYNEIELKISRLLGKKSKSSFQKMSQEAVESVVEFAVNMTSDTEINEVLSKQEGETLLLFNKNSSL